MPVTVSEARKQPDGSVVEVVIGTLPDPIPVEPNDFRSISPREFAVALLQAMVSSGVITAAKAQAIRDAMIDALKR